MFTIASTVDEALAALARGARPIAGGSDLVVGARHGKAPLPRDLVAVDRIDELHGIEVDDGALVIGAATSHHAIEGHPLIATHAAAVADGSALVGSPATRNVGTIGGNVMNASPAMDTGAPLVVLAAEVELRSTAGTRRIDVASLWSGPGRTTATSDELCTAVRVPISVPSSGSAYVRLEYRRAMEIAVVGAAAAVRLDERQRVCHVVVALTAVAPTILRVDGLEASIGGSIAEVAGAAREAAAGQCRPISDLRASDRYRRHTVGVMAERAVLAAGRRAAGERLPTPLNRHLGIGAER